MEKYYSTDLSLSIIDIKANSAEQANQIIHKFIDKIAPIMDNKIRWEECDWHIQENILDEKEGVYTTNVYYF